MPERFNAEFWDYVDQLVAKSDVIIDRPEDSAHPIYGEMIYPFDYGYLAGTSSADGAGIDVWMGASREKKVVAVLCTVDLIKRDSEVKILLGCTIEEMRKIVEFINQGDMRAYLVLRE